MEVWQQQTRQMLDQVVDYAEDWEECLNMVGELPETRELHTYLELLLPRLKRLYRRFNYTKFVPGDPAIWQVYNYTFKMWQFLTKMFPEAIVTPMMIAVPDDKLTPKVRDQFRQHQIP